MPVLSRRSGPVRLYDGTWLVYHKGLPLLDTSLRELVYTDRDMAELAGEIERSKRKLRKAWKRLTSKKQKH